MITKIGGLARALAILLAIVAGFMATLGGMDVALVLLALGLIAGLAMPEDRVLLSLATVIALPIIGTALTHIPTIGGQLNTVALNLQMAMAGSLTTVLVIRLYHLILEGVMGVAGAAGTGGAAAAAR